MIKELLSKATSLHCFGEAAAPSKPHDFPLSHGRNHAPHRFTISEQENRELLDIFQSLFDEVEARRALARKNDNQK